MKSFCQTIIAAALCLSAGSCDSFIDVSPEGGINEPIAQYRPEEMTTDAYAILGG